MSVDEVEVLVKRSWKGPLALSDIRRLGELLALSENSGERITLLRAAGRGHAMTLRPQVERFLSPKHDSMVFAAALATLTTYWALEREYRDVILAAVRGYPWDTDQDVRLRGLMTAPQLLKTQPDREVLEAIIAVAELPTPDPDEEGSVYIEGAKEKALVTLREILTPGWRELPSLERFRVPEGEEAAGILARAKQMLDELTRAGAQGEDLRGRR